MKLSTLRVYLMIYAIACGASNVSAMQKSIEKAQDNFYTEACKAGWVPSMASIPTFGSLRSSGDRIYCDHVCIPSSPARCNGSCVPVAQPAVKAKPVINNLNLPNECIEQQENIRKLKDLMKKIVQVVGKSEAVKIAKIALEESSDSDSDSSASLNSPDDNSDDLIEELKSKKK